MSLMTTKQAAVMLGLSSSYVKNLINTGKLVASKPGHDFLIDKKDVMALKKERERKSHANIR